MRLIASMMLASLVLAVGPATADEARMSFGGDEYAAGQSATINQPAVARDAFAAGYDVTLSSPVEGDAHLAGFNVRSDSAVGGDSYLGGFSITVTAPIGADLTAMGNSIAVGQSATIAGNARLAGTTITVSAPIGGSALITAQSLTLDGPITGDLNFFGEKLSFGPNAVVTGKLNIQAPSEIAVPASVAAPERVSYQQLVVPDYATEAGRTAEHVVKSFWPAVWATGIWWLLLFVVGLAFLGFAPRLVESLRTATAKRPFRNLGLGLLGFAAVIGLVPVSAMTVIGLLVTPLFVLFAFVMSGLAYLAGTYLVGSRLVGTLMPLDTAMKRAVALAVSIVVAGLLGMVPLLGWLMVLLLIAFGFGGMLRVALSRGNAQPALAPGVPA
jgi:hypothetical protein